MGFQLEEVDRRGDGREAELESSSTVLINIIKEGGLKDVCASEKVFMRMKLSGDRC